MKIKDTLKNIIKNSYKGSIIRAGDIFLVQRLILTFASACEAKAGAKSVTLPPCI